MPETLEDLITNVCDLVWGWCSPSLTDDEKVVLARKHCEQIYELGAADARREAAELPQGG